jgi:hypothetical protein
MKFVNINVLGRNTGIFFLGFENVLQLHSIDLLSPRSEIIAFKP